MAFDISTARPESGGFDISTAQPAGPEMVQTRRGLRPAQRATTPQRDPFEGLPPEVIADIEQRFPDPDVSGLSGQELRRRQRGVGGAISARKQAAELEQIRLINPTLAEQIEETGGLESFLVGAGRGLTAIPRAAGFMEEGETEKQALEGLKAQQPGAFGAGEIVGETAPFLAVGGPLAAGGRALGAKVGAKSALAGRALGTGVATGAEGFTLSKAEGATTEEALKTGAITAALGPAAELAGPVISRAGRKARGESLEAGRALLKEPTKKEVRGALAEATPSADQLKKASRDIYEALEADGTKIAKESFDNLEREILKDAEGLGMRPRLAKQTLGDVKNIIDDVKAGDIGVKDLEDIRKAAMDASSEASRAGRNQAASIHASVADNVDDFLSNVKTGDFSATASGNAGAELAAARKLWGKGRKQELLDEIYETGVGRAAGKDTGIRNEFRNLVNNKKRSRFFTQEEKDAMRKVSEGTPTANTFRKLGRMGFGQGAQTNVLGGTVSAGVGAQVLNSIFPGGGGAVVGAILFPTIGKLSASFAEKLTKKSAKLAGQYVRAGSDADEIAKIYLRSTPRAERSAEDLAALLMRPDLALKNLPNTPVIQEAVSIANEARRNLAPAAAVGGAAALPVAAEERE